MSTQPTTRKPSSLPIWQQLRWTLTLYFVILTVAPLVIAQYVLAVQVRDQTLAQAMSQLQSVSELKQGQIEQWLDRSRIVLNAVENGTDPAVVRSLLTTQLPQPSRQSSLSTSLWLTARSVNSVNEGASPTFDEIFVYNRDGVVAASTAAQQIGKVVSRQPYFDASLEGEVISSPFYDIGSNTLTMIVAQPLYNYDGTLVIGAIAGRLHMDTLGQVMLNRTGLGVTGETYLVSLENNYLVTPSRFEGYLLQHAYHTEGIDRALEGFSGSGIYTNYQTPGVEVVGVYTWLPELKTGLLAEISSSEALAPYLASLRSAILITIVAGLLAVAVGFFRLTQLMRPVTALANVARDIAQGRFERRVAIKERNEIGIMANAFNQMTEQLVEKIGQLDQRVTEINEANKALRVASAQAREASRLKDEFLAVMSHELRTPLNSIIGYAGIMQMNGDLPERSLHMIRRIRANSERLLHLINDVLDISRIESGRMELVYMPVNIRLLVQKLETQMGVLSEQKDLHLEARVENDVPDEIRTDEDAVTKIVTNLLSNAIKFTEQGKIRLHVGREADTLTIEVSDTGVGIPPHMHDIIFERFRQVDSSNKRAHGGSGLGLAIVRHLCTAMNGTVRVSSMVGQGSTFTVSLPLLVSETEGVEKAAHVL